MSTQKFSPYEDSIRELYHKTGKNITKTAEQLAKAHGWEYSDLLRRTLSSYISKNIDISRSSTLIEHSDDFKQAQSKEIDKSKYYIITCAQNGTPVFGDFLTNIEAYAKYLSAEILVIASRYKNPTSLFVDKEQDKWDDKVKPYLTAKRIELHPKLDVLGDIKVQPTSSNPLSRKELIGGQSSCIIGHPRVHLKSVPRLPAYEPKIMLSTGTVTMPNYTDSDSGKIGEAHHTFGFIIVEIRNKDIFHIRHVTADDEGNFIDLIHKVRREKVSISKKIAAISLGDIHLGKHDKRLIKVTENKIIKPLKPDHVIAHDISDMYSVRKHDMKDPILEALAHKKKTNIIDLEIDSILSFCNDWQDYNLVISRSNHDEHLDQYVRGQDWRKDTTNASTYAKFMLILLEEKAPKGLLPYLIDEKFDGKIKTLGISDSYRVLDWELGFHGHLGANGARGSNNTFKKLSTKIVKAHDHTPSRVDGCISNGTSTVMDMGYNKGLTTWGHSHTIIHVDGKAQQIIFNDYKFTTFKI